MNNQTIKKSKDGKSLEVKIIIPLLQDAHEWGGDVVGKIPNVIGVICGDERGFFNLSDMTYAGKEPQIGGMIIPVDMEEEEFEKLCEKLGISFYKYQTCSECYKVIYGSHTWGDKGPICFDCDHKHEEKE